jgi:hypothetical protein
MTSSPTSPCSTSRTGRRSCATSRTRVGCCGPAGRVRCRCAVLACCPGRSTWWAISRMRHRAAGCGPKRGGGRECRWERCWLLPSGRVSVPNCGRVAAVTCGCCYGARSRATQSHRVHHRQPPPSGHPRPHRHRRRSESGRGQAPVVATDRATRMRARRSRPRALSAEDGHQLKRAVLLLQPPKPAAAASAALRRHVQDSLHRKPARVPTTLHDEEPVMYPACRIPESCEPPFARELPVRFVRCASVRAACPCHSEATIASPPHGSRQKLSSTPCSCLGAPPGADGAGQVRTAGRWRCGRW